MTKITKRQKENHSKFAHFKWFWFLIPHFLLLIMKITCLVSLWHHVAVSNVASLRKRGSQVWLQAGDFYDSAHSPCACMDFLQVLVLRHRDMRVVRSVGCFILALGVNGCLSLFASPAAHWRPVIGLSRYASCHSVFLSCGILWSRSSYFAKMVVT